MGKATFFTGDSGEESTSRPTWVGNIQLGTDRKKVLSPSRAVPGPGGQGLGQEGGLRAQGSLGPC